MVDIIFPCPFLGAMGDLSKKKPGTAMCVGCGSQIHDQFILRVSPDLEWHAACLKCAECSEYLDETCTCFVRDGKTYCKRDYARPRVPSTPAPRPHPDTPGSAPERAPHRRAGPPAGPETRSFLPKGSTGAGRMGEPGAAQSSASRAPPVYNRTGEEPPGLAAGATRGNAPLFPAEGGGGDAQWRHRIEKRNEMGPRADRPVLGRRGRAGCSASAHLRAPRPAPRPAEPGPGRQPSLRPHVHKQAEKTTRVRTVLNEKQLHTLRTCYAANPRPDALMKEQLVEMTGLSPRVIRVWFQNKRCKDKKKSILMKQLQQQQHSDKTSLQGLTGTPLVAGSPIRHDSAVQGSAVEVQTYQPPWKALSEFALQSDLDQPAFQQLVSFSESGSLGNSSGSDVTSLSSQLPDTPNSMVPSPVET
ncbi:PREDICTED: insulin gene enhancer protein ISL-2 [Dipodomys ordii]|uniref:Insulin gene enhancer protein ISL-2 n=1 Tax=Dipodomys ordii TaxID=10020 RepID=A0A1S3ETZ3_DIPOR|nr:PREDICTED: insulin gene enhancer protein ISL-2 [Dipodomys ordii]